MLLDNPFLKFVLGFFVTFGVLAILSSIIKLWTKLTIVNFNSNVDLSGKTIIVTGANSGIGKATARFMANKGARVIMACRSMDRSQKVRDEIAAESENSKVVLYHLDVSSFESVRKFCKEIIENETRIDVLIHNAGYAGILRKAVSVDGIEYTMATNFYGPFLMTNLLSDLLKKSLPCRIVMVSSKAHTMSTLDPEDGKSLNPTNYWPPMQLYANSKFASLLFTFELAKRTQGIGITVNALHPGTVDTEIWRNYQFPMNVFPLFYRSFMRTIKEGTQTILYVALSKNIEKVSGKYFRNCQQGKPCAKTLKPELQTLLWEKSKEIVGLTDADHQF